MNTKFYYISNNKYIGKTDISMNNGMTLRFITISYNGETISKASSIDFNGLPNNLPDFIKKIKSVKEKSSKRIMEAQHNSIDFDSILIEANSHYA